MIWAIRDFSCLKFYLAQFGNNKYSSLVCQLSLANADGNEGYKMLTFLVKGTLVKLISIALILFLFNFLREMKKLPVKGAIALRKKS